MSDQSSNDESNPASQEANTDQMSENRDSGQPAQDSSNDVVNGTSEHTASAALSQPATLMQSVMEGRENPEGLEHLYGAPRSG
jgi:hypothetical protein